MYNVHDPSEIQTETSFDQHAKYRLLSYMKLSEYKYDGYKNKEYNNYIIILCLV